MSELVEYFTRCYTLVIDNDEMSYNAARSAAGEVLRDADVTLTQYKAMPVRERNERFAGTIGESIMQLINDWYEEAQPDPRNSMGGQLIDEAMMLNGSDLEYALGVHYMPEDADAGEILDDDDDDDTAPIPADFPVRVLRDDEPATARATCGNCGRSWDDAIPTSYTPAPSARCPFEAWH